MVKDTRIVHEGAYYLSEFFLLRRGRRLGRILRGHLGGRRAIVWGNIDRGGRGNTNSERAVKLKEGWDVVRHRDSQGTVDTIMIKGKA